MGQTRRKELNLLLAAGENVIRVQINIAYDAGQGVQLQLPLVEMYQKPISLTEGVYASLFEGTACNLAG